MKLIQSWIKAFNFKVIYKNVDSLISNDTLNKKIEYIEI